MLWVGKGRTIGGFRRFFEETEPELLSSVQAVAMDMNASFSTVVSEMLPSAAIVYDRYHMMSQFGREVMGPVRLDKARIHRDAARQAYSKDERKAEQRKYSELKGARWLLMTKEERSPDADKLNTILSEYSSLSVCYSMQEKLRSLFEIRDQELAKSEWNDWFDAAEASGIYHLMKFARIKRLRIPGLVSHAVFPISTGRIEGINNRTKVIKRRAYGYRDDEYFFSLIRFASIPESHTFSP